MSVLSTCINAYLQKKKIVFFGAGLEGSASFLRLQNAGSLVAYFVDNAPGKQGSKLYDIPIYHPDKLTQENKDELQIIITAVDYLGAAKQLFAMGFKDIYASTFKDANEKICGIDSNMEGFCRNTETLTPLNTDKVRNLFYDEISKDVFTKIIDKYNQGNSDFSDVYSRETMYFNDLFLNDMIQDEVYVDAGVHTVHTIIDFIFFTKGQYKKIYAFEPDAVSYSLLSKDIPYIKNVVLTECGLSDNDGEVFFDARGNGSSEIIADEKNAAGEVSKIKVVKLDTFLQEVPTFIKMDIEGAEYAALVGASETIKKHKPKLAISLYHKASDLIEIPLLLHNLVPEYKFYLKHHMTNNYETVLYAKI